MADFPSLLQHFESQPSDETGGVDRDGDISKREKEEHDIVRHDTLIAKSAAFYFLRTNSKDSEQKEVCYQRSCNEVHWKVESHERSRLAIPDSSRMLWWWYDAQRTHDLEERGPYYPWEIDGNVERKQNIDVYKR